MRSSAGSVRCLLAGNTLAYFRRLLRFFEDFCIFPQTFAFFKGGTVSATVRHTVGHMRHVIRTGERYIKSHYSPYSFQLQALYSVCATQEGNIIAVFIRTQIAFKWHL